MVILPIHDRTDDTARCSPGYGISQGRTKKTGRVKIMDVLQESKTHKAAKKNFMVKLDLNLA